MKCKINLKGEPCKLHEILKREITDQDCVYCITLNLEGITKELIYLLAETGMSLSALVRMVVKEWLRKEKETSRKP